MNNYFSVLLVLALFVIICVYSRWQEGNWYNPPTFFILFWTVICGFSILMAPDFYFSSSALLYILSLLIAFYTGSQIEKKPNKELQIKRFIHDKDQTSKYLERVFVLFLFPATLSGFIGVYLLLHYYGVSVVQLSSPAISEISSTMTSDRYDGISLPKSIMICLAFAYSGSLAGGFIFTFSKKWHMKVLALLPFLPVLIFTMIYTARAPFIFQVILFLSSVIASKFALKGQGIRLFTPKFFFWGSICGSLLFIVFMITQMSRMEAGYNFEQLSSTFQHLRVWFFGNISGFSVWFDQGNFFNKPSWGSYSIGGIYELLDLSTRKLGLYDMYVNISSSGDQSNIFTLFRLLIDDYSIFGVHILFFILGYLSYLFYEGILNGNWLYIPFLSAIYSFQLWSFIASFFTYNTNILAFLLFGLLFYITMLVKPNTIKNEVSRS